MEEVEETEDVPEEQKKATPLYNAKVRRTIVDLEGVADDMEWGKRI